MPVIDPMADGSPSDSPRADAAEGDIRVAQPWLVRLTHWINVLVLPVMAGSGLQILVAFPFFGPRGEAYAWFPVQGWTPPPWLRIGGWLAGARNVHFAFAWALVVNGLLYLAYVAVTGEWRRRFFRPRRDAAQALATTLHYLRIRKESPPQGFYNGLQRASYTMALALGITEVLSGLAIWKPIQLSPIAAIFGGYDGARVVHFLGLAALGLFVVVHVVLVALHPRTIPPMITGGPSAPFDSDPARSRTGSPARSSEAPDDDPTKGETT